MAAPWNKLRSLSWPAVVTILSRLLTLVLSFGTSVIIGRRLGPAGQGIYALASTLAITVSQFTNLGLHTTNTYLVADNPKLRASMLGISSWIAVALGGGVALAAAAVHQQSGGAESVLIWIAALQVPGRLFFIFAGSLLVALNRVTAMNLAQTGTYAALFFGALVASLVHAGVAQFLWVGTFGWSLSAVVFWWQLRQRGEWLPSFDFKLFRDSLPYSLKSYFVCLFTYLVLRSNVFLVELLANKEAVGLYSVAAQFGDAIGLVPTSIALLLFPRLLQARGNQWAATMRTTAEVAGLMLVACGVCALLARPFIVHTFGVAFAPAATVLLYMLPGTFFVALISIVSQYLAAIGYPRMLIVIWAAGWLLLVIASWILVPRWQARGAAAALSLSYAFVFAAQLLMTRSLRHREPPARPGGLPLMTE